MSGLRNDKVIKVIAPGTPAVTTVENISGTIRAVTIREGSVAYEFAYFYNGEYRNEWLIESELAVFNKKATIAIGFK